MGSKQPFMGRKPSFAEQRPDLPVGEVRALRLCFLSR